MKKKIFSLVFILIIIVSSFVGCGNTKEKEGSKLKIAALKGPTAMGMVKLIEEDKYDIEILGSPDEIMPKIIKGDIEIASIPANLGANLYNKTNGEIEVLAINTLGVLYLVNNGDAVKGIKDLEGKTIYSSGKGATPEYVLDYILEKNNLKDKVNIEYKSEHTECLSAILKNKDGIAMLPEPFVTGARLQNKNINVVLDINEEWKKISNGNALITGVLVGKKGVLEERKEEVLNLIDEYKASVDFTNNNVEEAAILIEKNNIVKKEIAVKGIENCNIVCITGDEMKEKLSSYLEILNDKNPKSIGGKLPNEDFYFIK
ncbi:ABC transporter substrate-binding protein [uncultured Clostridium sp.]|uniref:ABC transporter substrate-binding protein n=1 Tax=uncultured Clostridium sp. TaxID=59620 RepID=UPI00262A1657|nr:ABC transporter substrate-binding protein [uncultured Clostridium sp.]